MKKVFLMLALLTGFFNRAAAQVVIPVLTDWNANPTAGESFGYNQFNPSGFSPGTAGSQALWSFNSLGVLGHFFENCETASFTGLASTFPNANAALTRTANNYSFFDINAYGQTYYGNAVNTTYNNYYDGEDYLHLPFTYTNAYTDSFHSFNNGIYRRGKLTVTADGYGTLMFPSGTFQKVLRVHFQERFIDSTTVVILDQTTDLYKWYIPWIHAPAFVYGYSSSGGSPNYTAFYLDALSAVLGMPDQTGNDMKLNMFPNPAAGVIHISYYEADQQNTVLQLNNAMGAMVQEWNFANESGIIQHDIDLNKIAKGIYFIQLNNTARKKLVLD